MHRAITRILVSSTLAAGVLAGCTVQDPAYTTSSTGAVLSSAPTTVQHSTGRYQLYGDGSSASPHFWVWIPAGTNPPTPPPLPTTTTRVTAVSQGQYQLYGDGTTASPYYWVWVPAGTTAVVPPPPPPRR